MDAGELVATIITAIITAAASVAVALITVSVQNSKSQAVISTKIETLTGEVEKHNNVIERMFSVETDCKNLFHRYEEVKEIADEARNQANHAAERADAAHRRLDRTGVDSHA